MAVDPRLIGVVIVLGVLYYISTQAPVGELRTANIIPEDGHYVAGSSSAIAGSSARVELNYQPSGYRQNVLVKFDLNQLPAGSRIESAIYKSGADAEIDCPQSERKVSVYRASNDWNEQTTTGLTAPAIINSPVAVISIPVSQGLFVHEWDLSADIKAQYPLNRIISYTMVIDALPPCFIAWGSSEHPEAVGRLEVQYRV